MSILSQPRFHDESAAFAYVEAALWPDGPTCPHCGAVDRVSAIKPNAPKKVRLGLKFCGHCRKQFTVRVGTIFEDSHLPMTKWLQAIFLMCSSKKGVSSHQLMRTLETTYKTAWFLTHRIREAMVSGDKGMFGENGGGVEADETYYGRNTGPKTAGGWEASSASARGMLDLTRPSPVKPRKVASKSANFGPETLTQTPKNVRLFWVTGSEVLRFDVARQQWLGTGACLP